MLKRIKDWQRRRREAAAEYEFERGYGFIMMLHFHHNRPLQELEDKVAELSAACEGIEWDTGAVAALRKLNQLEEQTRGR